MKVRFSYIKDKFADHDLRKSIYANFDKLLDEGDFTLGKVVGEFETKFAEMIGVKHALGVGNGTDAIRVALRMVGVGPGDEVICPANTFVASVGAVDELFANPILVDMAPNHVMDTSKIEAAITPKTKAILPVHFKGTPVEMDEVMQIAQRYGIPVVEDTAQGFLGEYKGKCLGTIGNAGTFSLHPLKILNVMGDGGMIVTNDTELYEKMKLYRNHGLRNRDEVDMFGCNTRLDSLQAIIGLNQLAITPNGVERRRKNMHKYNDALRDYVNVCDVPTYTNPTVHLYMFEVSESIRDGLYAFLNEHGVEAKIHYPNVLQGALPLLGYSPDDFPMAKRQANRIITLPCDELLTDEQLDYVIGKVKEFIIASRERIKIHHNDRRW